MNFQNNLRDNPVNDYFYFFDEFFSQIGLFHLITVHGGCGYIVTRVAVFHVTRVCSPYVTRVKVKCHEGKRKKYVMRVKKEMSRGDVMSRG